jgi:UrcA family protein
MSDPILLSRTTRGPARAFSSHTTEGPARTLRSHTARGVAATLPAAIVVAVLGFVPLIAPAEQQSTPAAPSSVVVDVSLADLDLSTAEGVQAARGRLESMARRVCAAPTDNRPVSSQVAACVERTLTNALQQIDTAKRTNTRLQNSVTRAGTVSLAGLDVSTPAGERAARDRLRAMARRLCTELAHSGSTSYQVNVATCIDSTLTGALGQVGAIAAAKQSRLANNLYVPPSEVIRFADLDLRQAGDVERLYERIKLSVTRVCNHGTSMGGGSAVGHFASCFGTTLDDAVARLNRPALTALHVESTRKEPAVQQGMR